MTDIMGSFFISMAEASDGTLVREPVNIPSITLLSNLKYDPKIYIHVKILRSREMAIILSLIPSFLIVLKNPGPDCKPTAYMKIAKPNNLKLSDITIPKCPAIRATKSIAVTSSENPLIFILPMIYPIDIIKKR